MIFELNKEYKISRPRQILYRISAIVIFIVTIVSIPVSIMFRSVLPILSCIFLVIFEAHDLLIMASQTMLINSEGILLKNFRGKRLLSWKELGEISQGKGINRHKVSYTLLAKPPSPGINLGLCRFKFWEDDHLPSTFGMDAKELAENLEQTRKENIQQELK